MFARYLYINGHDSQVDLFSLNCNCFLPGGSLICCERCPASYHTQCAGLDKEPEGSYICIECLAGRTILHGDLVWAKIGAYRWWPAKVSHLEEIPDRYHNRKSNAGEFHVRFYGSHDHAFVYRGQVFHYQEGVSAGSVAEILAQVF